MWGLLLIGLLVELLVKLYDFFIMAWPFLVAGLALTFSWVWMRVAFLDYRAREARDRLRHERARQQISEIEQAAVRAMFDTAQAGEVIEGTATEVEPR